MIDAARLIRDTWEETAAERGLTAQSLVIFNAGDGFLGTEMRAFLGPQATITLCERDARLTEAALHRAGLVVAESAEPPAALFGDERPDMAILLMPKGRAHARRQILHAWQMLAPGGRLWICGPSQRGVKGLITDATGIFGQEPEVLAYKHRQRLVEVIRQDMPIDGTHKKIKKWYGTDGIMPGTVNTFDVPLTVGSHGVGVAGGVASLSIETIAGVFSWEHLDEGTAKMLETMGQVDWTGKVVADVGCGAGILGLAVAKLGAKAVLMSDVDRLAVACAQSNADKNHVGVVDAAGWWQAAESDTEHGEPVACLVAADNLPMALGDGPMLDALDAVVSNPAFHQGQEVDYSMAEQLTARAHLALKEGGTLWVVANKFLAYGKYLNPVFGKEQVQKVFEDNKFVVYLATKANQQADALDAESDVETFDEDGYPVE